MTLAKKVWITLSALAVVLLVIGYFRWWVPTRVAVDIGAGMLAKQVCSCMFVAGRELADCRADQFEMSDQVQVEILHDPNGVRAWVPLLGERTAFHSEGFGCAFE